jgi:hypothetical protein
LETAMSTMFIFFNFFVLFFGETTRDRAGDRGGDRAGERTGDRVGERDLEEFILLR